MSDPNVPESQTLTETTHEPTTASVTPTISEPQSKDEFPAETAAEAAAREKAAFGDILSQFEKSHARKPQAADAPAQADGGAKQREGTVISVTGDSVFVDIGFKTEGVLPPAAFLDESPYKASVTGHPSADVTMGALPKAGDKIMVTVKGRGPEGYYELSRFKMAQPKDWTSLERAFTDKAIIAGTVTGVVKGGLTVDVGVRAFLPASRSGTRDAAEMEKLVGQEIRCRITKLDAADEDVVVDRRIVSEEEALVVRERRYSELAEGDTVSATVRNLADYGAFVDIGGVDALLHVGEISWGRVNKPADVLTAGQQIEVRVLKISTEAGKRRIAVGMKQLQPHPWDAVAEKYRSGERVRGTVSRLMDFGAFIELEPGIEGLIHVSEMSWAKKLRKPGDMLKQGDTVEAVILSVNLAERRIGLGLKQALGDPWADAAQRFAAGTVIEGPVTNLTKFGAFVQMAEGVEGMIHVSDMVADRRINHPTEVLRVGQSVKALVLSFDKEKRQIKLGMKQLIPTGLDEFFADNKEGDTVTGRLIEVSGAEARVELGEGVVARCKITESATKEAEDMAAPSGAKVDLSSLSSMLSARWKGGAASSEKKKEPLSAGQIRSFKIIRLDKAAKKIDVELG